MISLSDATLQRVHCLFLEQQYAAVEKSLLETCGDNLPGVNSDYLELAERIRFAVLKLSDGDIGKLQAAIEGAEVDWRDTLMAAGFGSDLVAHLAWYPDCRHTIEGKA